MCWGREREGEDWRKRERERERERGGSKQEWESARKARREREREKFKEADIYFTSFFQERVYRPTESRQIGVIDPHSRMLVLHLYAGLLKVGNMIIVYFTWNMYVYCTCTMYI
jgi:hypothetical protein